ILNNFRIDNGKSVKMPFGGHFKLSLKDCLVRDCDVERMSKVLYENAVGSLMYLMVCTRPDIAYASGLPKTFWAEATCTAAYLINRSPSRAIEKKTPMEMWSGHLSDYGMLRIFGCVAYLHDKQGKLDSRAIKCVLLGYPEGVKGYRLYRLDDESPKIVTSRNAVFNESVIYKCTLKDFGASDKSVEELQVAYAFVAAEEEDTHEPLTYHEAIACEDNSKWKNAMKEEMDSLRKNKTWELVDHPVRQKLVSCKWLFKIKEGIEGVQNPRYKARLMAHGFTQRACIDYNEVFSLVVRHTSMRVILALTACKDYELEQLDVKTTFLHRNLEEVIYMRQPPGYEQGNMVAYTFVAAEEEDTHEPLTYQEAIACEDNSKWKNAMKEEMDSLRKNKTWELVDHPVRQKLVSCKWLFKIKEGIEGVQNPRYKARLMAHGFTQRACIDYNEVFSLVVRHTSMRVILALTACKDYELEQLDVKTTFLHRNLEEVIYMRQPPGYEQDDMLIACKSKAEIGSTKSLLKKEFDMKELEEAKKILDNGKSVKMPFGGHFKLSLKDCLVRDCDVERMSKVLYENAVGSLMYLMWNGFEIFAGYYKCRSITGYTFLVHECVVSWKGTLQHVVALSTTEAEYMAPTEAVKEAILLRGLLGELGVELNTVAVNCDNQDAIHLSRNHVFHERSLVRPVKTAPKQAKRRVPHSRMTGNDILEEGGDDVKSA
nr:copia LTR rider [Tanacetum cinerariifolium]